MTPITCTPTARITVTEDMRHDYQLEWIIDPDELDGVRLIDAIDRDELDLTYGDPTDPIDAAITAYAAEIITGGDLYDGYNAVTLTITTDGTITAEIDLDELDRIARAEGSLYSIAAVDVLASLTSGRAIPLAVLAPYLDAALITAMCNALTEIAEHS